MKFFANQIKFNTKTEGFCKLIKININPRL